MAQTTVKLTKTTIARLEALQMSYTNATFDELVQMCVNRWTLHEICEEEEFDKALSDRMHQHVIKAQEKYGEY